MSLLAESISEQPVIISPADLFLKIKTKTPRGSQAWHPLYPWYNSGIGVRGVTILYLDLRRTDMLGNYKRRQKEFLSDELTVRG